MTPVQVKDATFVIVDLETTGLSEAEDRILEIAAIKMRADCIEDTFDALIDPECKIPRRITQITGITSADIFGAPEVAKILPSFVEFIEDAIFVAHNCQFDWKFINAELHRASLPALKNRKLCTLRLARRLFPRLPSRSLGSLIKFFELQTDSRHRALSDAVATQQILSRMLYKLEKQHEITGLEGVLHFQNARYAKRRSDQQNHIRENILKKLPHSPGVYRMIGKNDKLLYVGKARVLSDRVRSYFAGTEGHARHIRKMVRQIDDIKWTPTATELEALLLESQVIKEHSPSFNKAGRIYRQRPFLRLGKIADSNWIILIEHIRADGARHYGPMESRKEAILVAKALVSLYGNSPSSFRSFEHSGVGLEAARIGGSLTDEGFAKAIAFLEGRFPDVLDLLKSRIEEASEAQDYELAIQRRDSLEIMERIHVRPQFLRTAILERTGVVLYQRKKQLEVHFMVYGSPIDHLVWPCDQKTFDTAINKFHDRRLHPPGRITMQQVDEISLLSSWMFKERENISVVELELHEPSDEFDVRLEIQIHKRCDEV